MPELENLDDVSFAELMKKSLSEIPQICPEWTDHNAHDPGITFLEMLMWLTEMQRYYLSRITESHLESYLRLLGTSARAAEPTVILARFETEEPVRIREKTVFMIGDIPYRAVRGTVIAPDKPEIFRRGGSVVVRRDLTPFAGGTLPLYFSPAEKSGNPMRAGFYPRGKIRARLISQGSETECHVEDGTFGAYQSGFICIGVPAGTAAGAELALDILSEEESEPLSPSRFVSDVRELVQLDADGNTMGADGRVKENVFFSADIGGRRINAEVYGEARAGRNAESPREAFERFAAERRALPRAVSAEDYARIALETPGLRAELVNVFSKEAGKVSVCVKPVGGSLRASELKNLRKALFEAKPVGTEIEILTPVVFSARLFVGAKTVGRDGGARLSEHIRSVFAPLEKRMGALIDMPELFGRIRSSPHVSEISGMLLRLGRGEELTERDALKLPEDGLLSLGEIALQ